MMPMSRDTGPRSRRSPLEEVQRLRSSSSQLQLSLQQRQPMRMLYSQSSWRQQAPPVKLQCPWVVDCHRHQQGHPHTTSRGSRGAHPRPRRSGRRMTSTMTMMTQATGFARSTSPSCLRNSPPRTPPPYKLPQRQLLSQVGKQLQLVRAAMTPKQQHLPLRQELPLPRQKVDRRRKAPRHQQRRPPPPRQQQQPPQRWTVRSQSRLTRTSAQSRSSSSCGSACAGMSNMLRPQIHSILWSWMEPYTTPSTCVSSSSATRLALRSLRSSPSA
mmetsp:Transcript_23450/g.54650  ORF Transcript_23450/g.54650 Transcript_23450/m.54650 type:complete len:271 (+) Transcript_23450:570-1382(+)